MMQIPHLVPTIDSKQLVVQGRPFLIRGAELQNSSFTSAKFMREIWPSLVDINLNTVLGCVTWEMIEPEEGRFDFSEIEQIIRDARHVGLKLILLWFGAWKNGMSNYVPSWVKLSPSRFPRVYLNTSSGTPSPTEIMTPFSQTVMNADAKAFAALMRHLKSIDEAYSTVIMVQPENECGILGDSRDRSNLANEAFENLVPSALIEFLCNDWEFLHPDLRRNLEASREAGLLDTSLPKSWTATFGNTKNTDELFMAYHYAQYLSIVAQAGKAEYALPMFCNFWLNYNGEDSDNDFPWHAGGGGQPGDYPSGGGVSSVLDIWQKFAPGIDFISPDIYLNNYTSTCATYRHRQQPLFIPEQRRDEYGARRLWAAVGHYQALGVAPFGVDSLEPINSCVYKKHFGLLASVSDIVLAAQRRKNAMTGFFFDEVQPMKTCQSPERHIVRLGPWEITIERAFVVGSPGPGFGLVIHQEDVSDRVGRFLLVGQGFQASFKSLAANALYTGILSFEEKEVVDDKCHGVEGSLRTLRRLNGDETRSGRFAIMPNEDPDYAGFPISITIPARTSIAEVKVYYIE